MKNYSLDEIKRGDKSSFKKLFTELYDPLVRFVTLYVGCSVTAEELVQDFFVGLWEKRMSLNIKSSLRSYIFTSVRNRALNYKRDNKPNQYTDDILDNIEDEIWADVSEFENEKIDELKEKVRGAIDDLPDKCREIFLLGKENGLTYSEISEELSISKKTVENQMGIALKKLKENLSPILFLMAVMF